MARSLWSGSIGFGLVNVPVKAYPAVRDHDVHFHRVEKDSGARVRNKQVAEDTERELDSDEVEMGFEVTKGRYVTFSKDELAEIRPPSTKVLEVGDFVPLADIDPVFYERTYWLGPDGDRAAKAYWLLLAAMEDRQLVAIGSIVMRNKQYLAAIRPMNGALAMSTMRFADEIVARADIDGLTKRGAKPDERALAMATALVDSMENPWRPERYHDTYVEEVRRRIKAKQAGKAVVEPDTATPTSNVVDLLAALERSVAAADRGRSAKTTARAKTPTEGSAQRGRPRATPAAAKTVPRRPPRTSAKGTVRKSA